MKASTAPARACGVCVLLSLDLAESRHKLPE